MMSVWFQQLNMVVGLIWCGGGAWEREIGGERAGDLIQVKGIIKKQQNNSILQKLAIPSGLRITGKKFTFQQTQLSKIVV